MAKREDRILILSQVFCLCFNCSWSVRRCRRPASVFLSELARTFYIRKPQRTDSLPSVTDATWQKWYLKRGVLSWGWGVGGVGVIERK